jgi:hypothetical protein
MKHYSKGYEMSKYETKLCTVYDIHNPNAKKYDWYDVEVALGSWDGKDDAEDERIFFYMDGEPLELGMIISESFLVTYIDGDE